MSDWHGYRVRDSLMVADTVSLFIGYIPNRKKPALYVDFGNEIKVLAYFIDEKCTQKALEIIDMIAKGTEEGR